MSNKGTVTAVSTMIAKGANASARTFRSSPKSRGIRPLAFFSTAERVEVSPRSSRSVSNATVAVVSLDTTRMSSRPKTAGRKFGTERSTSIDSKYASFSGVWGSKDGWEIRSMISSNSPDRTRSAL